MDMQVGDLVRMTHHKYEDLVGLLVEINENPSPGLDPMPYRVQWINPPEGHPQPQQLNSKWLEVVDASR